MTDIIIAVLGAALSVATFFFGRMSAAKNDGKEYGIMLSEIGYIKSGVDDMKKKMERADQRYNDLAARVATLEKTVAIYHAHGGEK